jgi:hypothetical protein
MYRCLTALICGFVSKTIQFERVWALYVSHKASLPMTHGQINSPPIQCALPYSDSVATCTFYCCLMTSRNPKEYDVSTVCVRVCVPYTLMIEITGQEFVIHTRNIF